MTISDRASLLNDAFNLADATQLPYNIAFDMTKYLSNELEYVPWYTVTNKMKTIRNLLYFQSDVFPLFRVSKIIFIYKMLLIEFRFS